MIVRSEHKYISKRDDLKFNIEAKEEEFRALQKALNENITSKEDRVAWDEP